LEHKEHGKLDYVVAHGVASVLVEKRVLVGSRHFLEDDEGISVAKSEKDVERMSKKGESILYIAIDKKLTGVIGFVDPVRNEAKGVVERMKNTGIHDVMMLTGDSRLNAEAVSEEVGISRCFPELLPHDKANITKELQQKGQKVIMVGDGINDSPALAISDVGVSFKGGSDIAQETAPVVLMDENLHLITDAIDISKETMRTIDLDFKAIIGINSLAALIALVGMGSPLSIALIHNGTTVGVTMNALRPIFKKLPSSPSDKTSKLPRSPGSTPPP
jgi:Cu2+-exporting ATPase